MKCNRKLSLSRNSIVFFVLMTVLSACNSSTKKSNVESSIKVDSGQAYTDTSTSFVKVYDDKGRLCIQQSNTYYELVSVFEGDTKIPLLLKINKVELCLADSVNRKKVYKIAAKSILDNKDIHWSVDFVGTDLEFKDNTLVAIHEGGDGEEDYITRYSMLNGDKIFSCSYGDLKISIPNVRTKRFVGYTSRQAASQPIQNRSEENLIALIDYSSSDKSIDEFKLKLKRSALATKIPAYSPEMVLVPANDNASVVEDGKALILMRADEHYHEADVKDFSVQYTFYFGDDNESTRIIIPVKNDRLDVEHAKYDRDIFELTR